MNTLLFDIKLSVALIVPYPDFDKSQVFKVNKAK